MPSYVEMHTRAFARLLDKDSAFRGVSEQGYAPPGKEALEWKVFFFSNMHSFWDHTYGAVWGLCYLPAVFVSTL